MECERIVVAGSYIPLPSKEKGSFLGECYCRAPSQFLSVSRAATPETWITVEIQVYFFS